MSKCSPECGEECDPICTFKRNANESNSSSMAGSASLIEAIKVLSVDMHTVSTRPCSTCKAMSEALGEPFGCYAYQAKRGR
ncbi:MAG: hypothetical protein PVI43_00320 [Candidatus Bathyarchaeota archaeon]|jgi:hypothetical protein